MIKLNKQNKSCMLYCACEPVHKRTPPPGPWEKSSQVIRIDQENQLDAGAVKHASGFSSLCIAYDGGHASESPTEWLYRAWRPLVLFRHPGNEHSVAPRFCCVASLPRLLNESVLHLRLLIPLCSLFWRGKKRSLPPTSPAKD